MALLPLPPAAGPGRDASSRPPGRRLQRTLVAIAALILAFLVLGGSPVRASAQGSASPAYRSLSPIGSPLSAPTGVAVDGGGSLYVTESSTGRLLVLSPGGSLLREKSGLSRPIGVAVSPDGKIYVGEAGRGRVEAFDRNLVPLFALGRGNGEFSLPLGIAVDDRGTVYVADGKADRVRVYDGVGAFRFAFGGSGDADGRFRFPAAVASDDASQEIVVTDLPASPQGGQGARVQVFSRDGTFKRAFASFGRGEGLLVKPLGAAVDGAGRIFVSDAYQNVVQVFDGGGAFLFAVYDPARPVRTPLGIAIAPGSGTLYVASLNTAQVAVYGTGGGGGGSGGPTLTFEAGGGSCSVGGRSAGGPAAHAAAGLLLLPLVWLGGRRRGRRGLPLLLLLAAASARAGPLAFAPGLPLASPNTDLIHYPHIDANDQKTCEACHFLDQGNPYLMPDWAIHAPIDNDDTMFNNLCRHCHNDILAPFARTHSSLTTSTRYGNWNMECVTCHEPHCQQQLYVPEGNPHLLEGTVLSRTDNTLTAAAGGWTDNQYRGLLLIPNLAQDTFVYRIDRNDGNTLTTSVPMDLARVAPGDPFAVAYGKLVRDNIATPAGEVRAVRLYRDTGANSLADGDATFDGVCEVCHTMTTHFRCDGGGSDPVHANQGGTAGAQCTVCHSHTSGFRHGGSGGPGTGCGDASSCHGLRESHPAHVGGGGGRHLSLACSDCHNTSNFPLFADNQSLAGTTVCNSCHSPGGTYDGVGDAGIGAKSNWDNGVYTGDLLNPGLGKWCAACHDETPSVIGGVTAPNIVGDESGSYPYGTGWGYYETGHGLSGSRFTPSSGGITYGAGLGCDGCHDLSTPHVDGLARTFDDLDNTTTSPSLYRQGYRLKLVGGQEPMLVPWPGTAANIADSYRLCAGCHATGPFTDNNNLNTNFVSQGVNRHEYHLDLFNQLRYPSDWSGAANSRITCVTCHNVHGSTRLAMVRDGKLVGREPGLRIWYYNPSIVSYSSASQNPPVPESLPLTASTGIVWSGGSSSNLCTHCHGNLNLAQLDRLPFQNVAVTPTLDWTGEAGFVIDGVAPDSGPGGTSFEFRVKYTDGNNDPPSAISLRIDRNDDGDFLDAGETVPLTEADAADNNYTDGKFYRVATVLDKSPSGSLGYRFSASDATGSAVQFDPVSVHSVSVANSVPTLAWTGQSGYLTDGVNPNGGPTGGTFEFRVLYADLDDEAPSFINLRIDRNDDGDFLDAGETVPMGAYDADPVYSDGKIYSVSVVLTLAGDGVLDYRFEASDGFDAATGTPASTSQPVTVTSGSNTAPTLSWTGIPGYAADGVEPDLGAGGRPFAFQVIYTDADGDLPGVIEVWVDRNDDGDYIDPGEKIPLTETDAGDTDATDGKTYGQTVVLDHPGTANKVEPIAYLFYAQDSPGADATGAPTSPLSVSVQDAIQVPGEVATITAAIASAVDGDIVLVAPGSYNEYINFNGKDNIVLMAADEPDGPNASILTNKIYAGNQNGGADNVTIYGFKVVSTVQPAFDFNLSQITVDHCLFDNNAGNSLLVNGGDKVTVRNSTFRDNQDEPIYLTYVGGFVDVDNCTFTGNRGDTGGAIYSTTSGTWNITNSTFDNNTSTSALQGGGAIYAIRGTMTIDNCIFRGNTASSTGGGGALFFTNAGSLITIVDTLIQGNSSGSIGGGAIYIENNNRMDLTNVILSGNLTTGSGGAVYEAGYANYLFCTISGNYAGNTGGAIYHMNSLTTTIRNSIVYNNDAAAGTYKQIYTNYRWNYVDVYDTLINQTPGSGSGDARLSYEDMGGNITGSDPLFVGGLNPADAPTTGGNYHLQSGSPCIGAASSGSPFGHDIDGDPRPSAGSYDMGADEF